MKTGRFPLKKPHEILTNQSPVNSGRFKKPAIPSIEGEVSDRGNLSLARLDGIENATVIIEQANGKAWQSPNGWECNMVKTVTLNHPIQAHGEWVTQLTIPNKRALG